MSKLNKFTYGEDRVPVFFDTEFTGLYQCTELISIGMVDQDGNKLYIENLDIIPCINDLEPWILDNVISKCKFLNKGGNKDKVYEPIIEYDNGNKSTSIALELKDFKKCIIEFLDGRDVIFISDCMQYDWVLLCEIFGGALFLPDNVYYLGFDISPLLKTYGYDMDIEREKIFTLTDDNISLNEEDKHNALYDAEIIKLWYNLLDSVKKI